ncbi:MAG: hypothetical protein NPIRA01_40690 [Nitrospirales bacterium]|nr:MAG: hypothetical protein NPIRA01_40690 [Nitrospirales bacterium]
MIETAAALESIKKADEAIGVIGKLVAKLKAQPDLAALKLAEALDEIGKTWQVMDKAITQFLKLGIDSDAMEKGSEVLLRIEGGGLLNEVKDGRGHCHIIGNIFYEYLDRWFEQVLKGAELDSIRQVFNMLSEADDDVFLYMEIVAAQLQREATEVLNMVSTGKVNEAKSRVLAFRKELQPLRLGMSGTMQKLYNLKSDFIQISGVA